MYEYTHFFNLSVKSRAYKSDFVQHTGQCMNYYVHYLPPSCSAALVLCRDPAAIVNGRVTFTGNSVGDTATYTCDPGFELIGVTTTTCTLVNVNTAEFIPDSPSCRREYCMNIGLVTCHKLP